jgi:hypothetical protein
MMGAVLANGWTAATSRAWKPYLNKPSSPDPGPFHNERGGEDSALARRGAGNDAAVFLKSSRQVGVTVAQFGEILDAADLDQSPD